MHRLCEVRDEGERAVTYIYGTIGEDWSDTCTTARGFAKELDALGGKPLDVRIDSLGGDVYEGFAIASAIQRYKGETVAYVDGVAASAASYVAMVCDKVVMADYAEFMIHDAWAYAMGNSRELMDVCERLDAIDGKIAGIISARSGMALEDVKAAMDAETWYGADEAREAGFCDEVTETGRRLAACADRKLLARYKHVPKALLVVPEPEESHADGTIEGDGATRVLVLGNRVYREKE